MPLSSRTSRPWPFLTDVDRTKTAYNSRPSTAVQEVEAQQLEHQASQVHQASHCDGTVRKSCLKKIDSNLQVQPQITVLHYLVTVIAQPAHIGSHQSNVLLLLFSCELKPSSA